MESKTQDQGEDVQTKVFTSGKGIGIQLRAVSQFKLNDLLSSKKVVKKPTYEAKSDVTKEVQLFELDEKTAKHKGRMDEWEAYLKEAKAAEAEYSGKFSEMMVWDGVDVAVPGPDSDWQKECDHFGIPVPTDPISRKICYVYREMLAGPEDLGFLIADILQLSQMDQEAVTKIRDSFRSSIQKQAHLKRTKGQGKLEDKQPVVE